MPSRIAIRFSPRSRAMIDREAEIEGISTSAFIREAALALCWLADRGNRGAGDVPYAKLTRGIPL